MMPRFAWCCPTDWETRFLLLVYLKNVLMGRALLRYSIEKLYIEIKNPYAGEGAVRDGLMRWPWPALADHPFTVRAVKRGGGPHR